MISQVFTDICLLRLNSSCMYHDQVFHFRTVDALGFSARERANIWSRHLS